MLRTLAVIAMAAGMSLAPSGESSEANATIRFYSGYRGAPSYHRSYRSGYRGYGYSPYHGRTYYGRSYNNFGRRGYPAYYGGSRFYGGNRFYGSRRGVSIRFGW